jgi:hypothetical protein
LWRGKRWLLTAARRRAKTVPDEAIKKLQSALTVVDGKVVYDQMR